MASVPTTNPFLSIDKKYFDATTNGRYVIREIDLIDIPKLKNLVDVSYLKDGQIVFDSFSADEKIEIGKLFFKHKKYIKWIGDIVYIDFSELLMQNSTRETLIYEISKLSTKYFFQQNRENNTYILSELPKSLLDLLIQLYFFARFKTEETHLKYTPLTDTLTDVDLNLNKYSKLEDDIQFIVEIFDNWIRTSTNTIPFSPEYGNSLKELLQEKNIILKLSLIKSTIISFFEELSLIYTTIVRVDDISVNILDLYGIEIKIFLNISNTPVEFTVNG